MKIPVLKSKSFLIGASAAAILVASGCVSVEDTATVDDTAATAETVEEVVVEVEVTTETETQQVVKMTAEDKLAAILEAQPDEVKARYDARHPAETLAFFGIEPGMVVGEALPGGGWYSKILIPYLGEDGVLVGVHYPDELWGQFGFGDEWTAARVADTANWKAQANEWGIKNGASIGSGQMTKMPDQKDGLMDAMLFIRALHNLNRFSGGETDYMGDTLAETFDMLRPGGIVGVVQHQAPDANSDDWANGSNGYLKKDALIASFEAAGFEYVGASDINANPADVPTEDEFVWRLPPALAGTEEGTPEQAAYLAIGESNRMTLKFRKPE